MTLKPSHVRARTAFAALAAAAILTGAGCSTPANADLQPAQASFAARAAAQQATNVEVKAREDGGFTVNGKLEGDHFAMAVPADWNGQALVFAHGYSVPGSSVTVSEDPADKDPSGGLMKGPMPRASPSPTAISTRPGWVWNRRSRTPCACGPFSAVWA